MFKLEKILAACLLFFIFAGAFAVAGPAPGRDQERSFRKPMNQRKGNERSVRPGRMEMGELRYGGNGCPQGTMRIVFAPDHLSFSVLFDQFVADTSTDAGKKASMNCVAELPITLPHRNQMEITRVDYRGFVSVPKGGRGMLHSVFNFVEKRNDGDNERDRINVHFNFQPGVTESYELSTGDMNEGRGLRNTEVSPCGGKTLLRIRNEAQVKAARGEQAQLTVDSIDGSSNATYYVNWKNCDDRPVNDFRPLLNPLLGR